MKRVSSSILYVCVCILISVSTAYPSILNVDSITADNGLSLYLSTDDSTLGTPVLSNSAWEQVSTTQVTLTPGVTNYIHVIAEDYGVIAGFAGLFSITGSDFTFDNNTTNLDTAETAIWNVSTTGFGNNDYQVPTLATYSSWNSLLKQHAIWTNNGHDIGTSSTPVTRYFSASVNYVPEPATLILLSLGGLILRRKK